MIQTYIIIAVLLCAATLAARGSARRLIAAGAIGALIVFFIHPLAQLTGAYSRHLVAPTPFGFSFVQPQFWLIFIVALANIIAMFASKPNPKTTGIAGVAGGITVLVLLWTFNTSSQSIVSVTTIPWVLEVIIPLVFAATVYLIARELLKPKQMMIGYGLSVVIAIGVAAFVFSDAAAVTFDSMRNYYRVIAPANPKQEKLVVQDWSQDLEFTNKERARINAEWTASQASIVASQAELTKAETVVSNSQSLGGQVLEFAQNARREAERTVLDAFNKRDQLAKQRLEYGISGDKATLEPLTAIATATALPQGYSVGRESGEANARRIFPNRAAYGFGSLAFFGILMLIGGITLVFRGEVALETRDLSSGAMLGIIIAVLAFGFNAVEFDIGRFIRGFPFIQDFGRRSFPPDWNAILSEGLKAMTITIATAMIGTVLAAVLAVPSSFLAARNLTQKSWWGRTVYPLMRGFYNLDRGVDTLILALVFVAAVGLGPLAGVLAMAIHSMADLGKLYSEAIENAEKGPIEALEASGAPGTSIIRWGVLPQVLPLFVSYTLYRFEINFRVSIILGFVGAGGVGFLIQETMRSGKYDQMIILVGLVVLMVNILDFISANVRRRLVG